MSKNLIDRVLIRKLSNGAYLQLMKDTCAEFRNYLPANTLPKVVNGSMPLRVRPVYWRLPLAPVRNLPLQSGW